MGEEAGLPFLLEAVALAADVDDVGVVEQAVEDGACDHRVAAEDLAPGTEAFVAGQDDAATFVAARDHLEEQIALELVERQIADLVDDEQARVRVVLSLGNPERSKSLQILTGLGLGDPFEGRQNSRILQTSLARIGKDLGKDRGGPGNRTPEFWVTT